MLFDVQPSLDMTRFICARICDRVHYIATSSISREGKRLFISLEERNAGRGMIRCACPYTVKIKKERGNRDGEEEREHTENTRWVQCGPSECR